MRILFVSSNSTQAYIDIEREQRTLLRLTEEGNHFLKLLPAARIADLERELEASDGQRQFFDVLHFAGHGTEDQGILLKSATDESENDEAKRVEALGPDKLAEIVAAAKEHVGLKLLVLNACNTEKLVDKVHGLVDEVIGTKFEVKDRTAKQFTGKFYEALNENATVEEAFRSAAKPNGPYTRVGNEPSITLPPSENPDEQKVEGLGAFYAAFYGDYIDEQIGNLERDRRLNNVVFGILVLIGIGIWIYLFQSGVNGGTESALWFNLKTALGDAFFPGTKPGEPDLFSIEGLWTRMEKLEAFAPVLIAFVQKIFFFSKTPQIKGLQRLRECLQNWDYLPDEEREVVRSTLHTSLKESLQK